MVVDGLAGRLDEEDVAAADGFVDGHGNLAVGKGCDGAVAEGQPQLAADAFGQALVGVGGEYLDILTMRNHFEIPL